MMMMMMIIIIVQVIKIMILMKNLFIIWVIYKDVRTVTY